MQCNGENVNPWIVIDEDIAQRLQPLRDYLCDEQVLVRALPDVAAGFGERTESGDVYFVLQEGNAKEDDKTGETTNETWILLVVVMLPHRYTKKGVYDVMQIARDLLVGYKPRLASSLIKALSWRFFRDDSQWIVESRFSFDINILEDTDITPDITPMITEVTINTATMTEVVT